ncbi:jg11279, partial [Pararge aegeria aegeria]
AHPVEANAEAAPSQVKRRWLDEELDLLARTEALLTLEASGPCTNVALAARLPQLHRTLEAIKGQRRAAKYKGMVKTHLAYLVAQKAADDAGASSSVDASVSAQESGEVESADADDQAPVVQTPISVDAARVLSDLLAGAEARIRRGGLGARAARHLRHTKRHGFLNEPIALDSLSNRKRRRMEYARVQELFRKCPGRAAAEVIDGHCRETKHSLEEMEAYWRPILEAVSNAPGPTPESLRELRPPSDGTHDYSKLWAPITEQEVKASRVDPKTAPGPDGIRAADWSRVSVPLKAEIFNHWMTSGEIPEPLRQCRTVFVPKSDAPQNPGEYRPISIASVPLRHMHSILARRLLDCCPPDMRQRGFVCADGTVENTAVLDAVLGDSRKKLRECHMAVLDFSKAFDTVSHAALVELLRARGLPGAFCSYIARLYETAHTTLAV